MQKITIIGASDGFGFWLAKFIKNNFSKETKITITGRNKEKLEKKAKQINAKFSTNNIESVKNADITIFAVPIEFMVDTIKKTAPHLKKSSMVLDVCSVKEAPSEALKKYCSKDVFVLPTHPMFGPFVSSIAGQIFVLCPLKEQDKNDKRYKFLKNFLISSQAKVIEETPKNHDKMMAVVQGLTHFNMFVLAETMKKLDFPIKKSFNFVSPIYKIMISSVGRYVSQNPKLYADIQMFNSEILEVHKKFMQATNDFNKYVLEKDEESFIENIEESKKYFGENAKAGQVYTDKLIFLISKQQEIIKKNIGKKISLENIYSRENKIGILKKFENNKIFLDSGELLDFDEWVIK